jgi:hypothetical protein
MSVKSATQSKFLHFKQATVSAMRAKLHQFDEAFRNEIVRLFFNSQKTLIADFFYLLVHLFACAVPPGAFYA